MRRLLGIERNDKHTIKQIKTFLDHNKIINRSTNQRNVNEQREKHNTIRDNLNFYVNIAHLKYQRKLNWIMIGLTIAILLLTVVSLFF